MGHPAVVGVVPGSAVREMAGEKGSSRQNALEILHPPMCLYVGIDLSQPLTYDFSGMISARRHLRLSLTTPGLTAVSVEGNRRST